MADKEYVVSGFSFSDVNQYKEAKSEAESIEYMKANTDLNNVKNTIKLYHRLVERGSLKTIVGYAFLIELRTKIGTESVVDKDQLPLIPVVKRPASLVKEQEKGKSYRKIAEDYQLRHRNSRIINGFLISIIAIMIGIAIFSDKDLSQEEKLDYETIEEQIIDQYASWKEELQEREEAILKKEAELFEE